MPQTMSPARIAARRISQDFTAGGADSARGMVAFTHQCLGEQLCQGVLAASLGAGDQIEVGKAVLAGGSRQILLDPLVSQKAFKCHA